MTASGRSLLVVLALLELPAHHAQATCLQDGIPAADRKSIPDLQGVGEVPFGLWLLEWDSAILVVYIAKLLAEEVLGYKAVISGRGGSPSSGLFAVAGCLDPLSFATDPQCRSSPTFFHHAVLEVWGITKVVSMKKRLEDDGLAELTPDEAGDMGYIGVDGTHVFTEQKESAFQTEGLALEYYRSYHVSWTRPWKYFDNYTSFDPNELHRCNETRFMDRWEAEAYLNVTGDRGGVEEDANGRLSARCWHGRWWFAPACRNNPETCIPSVTGADGWAIHDFMQRAATFSMPLAVTIGRSWSHYVSLNIQHKTLPYWWQPDSTFVVHRPTLMIFPPYNAIERAQGVRTSNSDKIRLTNWVHNKLKIQAPTLRTLIHRMSLTMDIIEEMLLQKTQQSEATHEQVACDWVRANEGVWRPWIQIRTECTAGTGLVDAAGSFVTNRANASTCAWCAPGRSSIEYRDILGMTHLCNSCEPGRSQPNPGQVECDLCNPGSFTEAEQRECKPCPVGSYSDQKGAANCTSCRDVLPAAVGFTTPFAGAANADKCICGEGLYRDAHNRGSCLKCKFGMTCKAGSDALGLVPEHAAQHPDTPLLNPGFWSSVEEPLSVFRCESSARCPGGRVGHACAAELTSQSCAHCSAGFSWSGHVCEPCMESGTAYVVFPILPCALVPVMVILVYRFFRDEYSKWDAWRNGVGATVFLLVHHYHIMNVIRETSTAFPPDVKRTFLNLAFFSDVWSLFRIGCYGLGGFSAKLVLQSLSPVFLFVGYVATWGCARLLARWYPDTKMDLNRTLNGFFSLIFLFFTGIADAALTLFKCSSNPNGKHSLIEDRSIVCYAEEWNAMLAVGILAVLFWCIGLSMAFSYVIWTAPRNFHKRSVQVRWKFLFNRYRPDVHWWALTFMAKGIVMNLGAVIIPSGLGQLLWIAAVLFIYSVLASTIRPWRHALNNIADACLHASLSMVCTIMAWFVKDPADDSSESGDQLGTVLFAVLAYGAPMLVVIFGLLLYWTQGSNTARQRKELDTLLIVDSIFLLCMAEDCKAFLNSLCQGDFLSMVTFKNIVQMELASRRFRSGYSPKEVHEVDIEQLRCSLSRRSQVLRTALTPPVDSMGEAAANVVESNQVAPLAEKQASACQEAQSGVEKLVWSPETQTGDELISFAGVKTELL